MREIAYAKLNLALHVRERMPDGYHRIETIFAFAEDGDVLSVEESDRLELTIEGPFAPKLSEEDNLVLRAARALRDRYAVQAGARLCLDKRLPVAAGLGGGSADAAAALRLLTRFWQMDVDRDGLHEIARTLGADVPACLASRTVRGEGRGEELVEVDGGALSGMLVLLVNPRVPMATGPVFAGWDGVDRGALGRALLGRNDLLAPARALAPVIDEVLAFLSGASFAGLSGSGATCFALYESEGESAEAEAAIAAARPDWWTMRSRLR